MFAANDIVYSGLELAIYTLLTHNKNVHIYILTMDLNVENPETGEGIVYHSPVDWQRNKLNKIVRYLDRNSHITFVDAKEEYFKCLDDSVNRYTCFTPFAALRLVADKLLPFVDRVLYFDCDVAVTGNILEFYNNFCAKDIYYGAYVTPEACEGLGEMVSGVMFMNLDKMRKDRFLERARKNYCTNQYYYPDQMALRDVGDPEKFPPTIGYCDNLDEFDGLPLVIHFTNQISPKIYCAKNREFFFKKFPFLKYAKEGIALLDTM